MEPESLPAGEVSPAKSPAFAAPAAQPKRLAVNFAYLTAGEMTAKLLTFASFSFLAHHIGPANYGILEFTLAVMTFFTLPADLGLSWYGAREVARNPDRGPRLLHEITGLRFALTLCSMATLVVFILVLHKSFEQKALLGIYCVSLLATPFQLQWFFQAYDRMKWVGVANIVRQFGFAGLVFLCCRSGYSLLWVGFAECVSVTCLAIYCILLTRYRLGAPWPWPDLHVGRLLGHIRESLPIGLSELSWAFMWYFCTVLLGLFYPDKYLGWFGASHRTVMAMHTFVVLYFFNLLPSISRCVGRPNSELLQLMDRSVRFVAWTGLYAAAALSVLAPWVLQLLYGKPFRAGSGTLVILVWMLPIAMLSGHHRFILLAYNRQTRLLGCMVASAVAAVVSGLVLTPLYGGRGAACALIIANALNLVLVYFSVRKLIVTVPLWPQLKVPLAALGSGALIFFALVRWNLFVALAAGSLWYLAVLAWKDGSSLLTYLQSHVRGSRNDRVLETSDSA
jgi:O-antigen/teichoic acid export membrane protein